MKAIIKILVCISPILLGGVCEMVPMSDPVEYEDVIGEYKANFSDEFIDMLTLNTDSTYVHYFKSSLGVVHVDTNSWRLDYLGYKEDNKRHAVVMLNAYKCRFASEPSIDFRMKKYQQNPDDSTDTTMGLGVFKKDGSIAIGFETYGNTYKKIK